MVSDGLVGRGLGKTRASARGTRSSASEMRGKRSDVCPSCRQTFPSPSALSFHIKTRLATHNMRRIDEKDYNIRKQMLVCPFARCCFAANSVTDMGSHLTSGKHGSRRAVLEQKKVRFVDGELRPSELYVVSRGVEEGGASSTLTCPSCLRIFSSEKSLKNHVTSGSCPGIAVWGCPHCATQCSGRTALSRHMGAKHALAPSLNLTGVFQGKTKDRIGKTPGGSDSRPIEAFTFLAPRAVCLSAEEIFDSEQSDNLSFLIERAQGGQGDYIVSVNTASLCLTSSSRKLQLFRSQGRLKTFTTSDEMDTVKKTIFDLINRSANQVANVSSGLSLHCIKLVTLTFGPASGLRGAGGDLCEGGQVGGDGGQVSGDTLEDNGGRVHDDTEGVFPSDSMWGNKVSIRGAVSLKITEEDLREDRKMTQKCFQHAVLHNLFYNEFRMKKHEEHLRRCEAGGHKEEEGLCTFCSKMWEREVSSQSQFAKTFLPYVDRVNWDGLEFPIGAFSYKKFCQNNPEIRLFVYRQIDQGGDVFQEFRSEVEEGKRESMKNIHLIFTSRVCLEKNELQSHFLSVNNLAHLCAKILNYGGKLTGKASKRKYEDGTVCEQCCRLFTFNTSAPLGPQVKRMHKDFVNGEMGEKKSQLYLDHAAECGFSTLGSTTMPKKGATLSFKNIKCLHDKPVTLFSDYETSHCSLSKVCSPCMSLYKEARGSRRAEILTECKAGKHILMPGGMRCDHCQQHLLESVEEVVRQEMCDPSHQKLTFSNRGGQEVTYPLCQGCLDKICLDKVINPPCSHSKTSPESALEVISFSIVAVENFGRPEDEWGNGIKYPRIIKEHTFVAGGDEDEVMGKFWDELRLLRPMISEKWKGSFPNLADCPLSDEEEARFESEKDCYACRMPFDPPPDPDNQPGDEMGGDELGGDDRPAYRVRIKNRDHCHRTGQYRGKQYNQLNISKYLNMCVKKKTLPPLPLKKFLFSFLPGALCSECNMRIDPVRPEADIYFHNLTGFDGKYK